MSTAVILTIGNELVSGDVENTNGSWLARRLEELGLRVLLIAALPDEIEPVAELVREQALKVDLVVVTGGLGGTPDDLTREAIAEAFGVPQEEQAIVAAALRVRFPRDPDYVTRWARLPAGARPLENPLGGAPGFVLGSVVVLPGLPAEMEAMWESVEEEFRAAPPIGSWRRSYRTTESRIAPVLVEVGQRHPGVLVGSYPSFPEGGSVVEIVLKSSDLDVLAAAAAWLEATLEKVTP